MCSRQWWQQSQIATFQNSLTPVGRPKTLQHRGFGFFRNPDVVADASKGVAAVARDTGVPLILGVLTTDTLQQALERAGIKTNLGWSYGLQALEMGSLLAALPA
jgi:hypothetical protein